MAEPAVLELGAGLAAADPKAAAEVAGSRAVSVAVVSQAAAVVA